MKRKDTSNSATQKLQRAKNQIDKAEILLRGMPLKLYNTRRSTITDLAQQLQQISLRIESDLMKELESLK